MKYPSETATVTADTRGFSLLEALVAMAILSGALILLANAWGGAFRSIKKGKQQHEVALLLERKLAEIDLEFRNKPLTEIPEEREDDFGSNYPQARWKLKSREFELPDLSPMLKTNDQPVNPELEMIFKLLSEAIKKSVKEVKVTVLVKDGTKTKEYSAVTYFVDYNQPLSLGGAGTGQ
jgi:general secretion pathway protein I